MPCTPPPGGVDDEHRNRFGTGVAYGSSAATGRKNCCDSSEEPREITPPTGLAA
jgi:hypothetical protein